MLAAERRSAIVQKAYAREQVLHALLGGRGLRIGESLALETNHLSADFRTITVEQSCWAGTFQSPKTKNARRRVVDQCPTLAELLKAFVGNRQSRLVFANRVGKPLSPTNVVRSSPHPI